MNATLKTNVTLKMSDNVKLCNLITREYRVSKLSDTEFAKFASEKLKLPINTRHVYNRRHSLKVQTSYFKEKKSKTTENKSTLSLKQRVERLEKICSSYIKEVV